MTLQVEGLRWHDPDHANARCPVVGAPSRGECHGVVAPPRSWGRGIRNAAHRTSSTAFLETGAIAQAAIPTRKCRRIECVREFQRVSL